MFTKNIVVSDTKEWVWYGITSSTPLIAKFHNFFNNQVPHFAMPGPRGSQSVMADVARGICDMGG